MFLCFTTTIIVIIVAAAITAVSLLIMIIIIAVNISSYYHMAFCFYALYHEQGFCRLHSKETLYPILKRTCWSLNLALQGARPCSGLGEFKLTSKEQKLSGTPLASTWGLTEIKGDWQWHVILFQMWSHYWKCGTICFRCVAARIPRLLVWLKKQTISVLLTKCLFGH